MDYARFRANVRDQMLVERVREREVHGRIRVSDAEIDDLLESSGAAVGANAEINIAQILVTVPEGASEAEVAERRARAEEALARVRGGEAFDGGRARGVARTAIATQGGEIGLRPADAPARRLRRGGARR